MPKFEDMNETDVREIIVRPLLAKLGYEHGTDNNIRTEQTFRYGKAYLGRKNPSKDPPLTGRADYILEVIGVGRWVVEVKAPSEEISRGVVEQAHTYAAHPEVAALFFLVTNGRMFQLYRTSALSAPLMSWNWEDTDEVLMALGNLIGPEAIKRKMKLLDVDKGKPLSNNIASAVNIIGGFIRYEDHTTNHPLLDTSLINGLELPVTGGEVKRIEDGRIYATIKLAKSAPLLGSISEIARRDEEFDFYSSVEYISNNSEAPTIFQSLYNSSTPAGTLIPMPGMGKFPLPCGFTLSATTEAVSYTHSDAADEVSNV